MWGPHQIFSVWQRVVFWFFMVYNFKINIVITVIDNKRNWVSSDLWYALSKEVLVTMITLKLNIFSSIKIATVVSDLIQRNVILHQPKTAKHDIELFCNILFTCFRLMKGCVTLLPSETNLLVFLHLMMVYYKGIIIITAIENKKGWFSSNIHNVPCKKSFLIMITLHVNTIRSIKPGTVISDLIPSSSEKSLTHVRAKSHNNCFRSKNAIPFNRWKQVKRVQQNSSSFSCLFTPDDGLCFYVVIWNNGREFYVANGV